MKNSSINLFKIILLLFIFSANISFAQSQKAGKKQSKMWEGTWQTNWDNSSATMELAYNKKKISGTYDFLEGKISGTVYKKNNQKVLVGTWNQSNNNGWFRFTMNEDNDSFSGIWGYKNSQETVSAWNGNKRDNVITPTNREKK